MAIGRRMSREASDTAMNTIHCMPAPPPASAVTEAAAAATATGPRKKLNVKVSPMANTPAAIIHQTHSSTRPTLGVGPGGRQNRPRAPDLGGEQRARAAAVERSSYAGATAPARRWRCS